MVKSILKRMGIVFLCIFLCVCIALLIYLYPRRVVPSLVDIVPAEKIAVCLRAERLGPVWNACTKSTFGRKVLNGELSPVREKIASDARFGKKWGLLDTPIWNELLGRECVIALYAGTVPGDIRAAVWSRIGFKTRFADLALRILNRFWPVDKREVKYTREGALAITEVMDPKSGTAIFSYALLGDLGIALHGRDDEFWKTVSGLIEGSIHQPDILIEMRGDSTFDSAPGAGGSFFINGELARACIEPRAGNFLRGLLPAAAEWKGASGRFTISGNSLDSDISIAAGPSSRSAVSGSNGSSDPLAMRMERQGLLYAGFRADVREGLKKLMPADIEFVHPKQTTDFPAEHFDFSWVDRDASLLLYRDARGMIHAAVSMLASDPALAKARVVRFLKLANGARIAVTDRSGKKTTIGKEPFKTAENRSGTEPYYRIHAGEIVDALYSPVVFMREGRVIIASAESALTDLGAGEKPLPSPWNVPADKTVVLRGKEMAHAAVTLRQILVLASPFLDKKSQRRFLAQSTQILSLIEWLAPVEEAWSTAIREGDRFKLRVHAGFTDTE